MKKFFKFTLWTCFMFFASLPVLASGMSDDDEKIDEVKPIVIKTDLLINPHRSSVAPFDMYYQYGIITAEFYENIGMVTVVVINTDTGEMWNTMLDSSAGMSVINISSINPEGYYELSIVDGNNISYIGFFEL